MHIRRFVQHAGERAYRPTVVPSRLLRPPIDDLTVHVGLESEEHTGTPLCTMLDRDAQKRVGDVACLDQFLAGLRHFGALLVVGADTVDLVDEEARIVVLLGRGGTTTTFNVSRADGDGDGAGSNLRPLRTRVIHSQARS